MSSKKKHGHSKLIVFSAPSGSGKSTLISMLIEKYPSNFRLSISHTTRLPRGQEKDSIHYFFIDETQFQKMITSRAFLEHAQVFGKHYYGTSKKFVEDTLNSGINVVFDIDVQGASQLKKAYEKDCVSIFIHPPSLSELERRLRDRKTDSDESIRARLKTAEQEISQAQKFDYQITNLDLQKTFLQIEEILKKENCI